jgi:hypothetical protein
MFLKQRAIIRRAFWRRIEIEYEISLTKLMGDKLDPFHHMDYSEWHINRMSYRMFDQTRDLALKVISSKIVDRMHSKSQKFDPSKLNNKIMLLNSKYREMSRIESQMMSKR